MPADEVQVIPLQLKYCERCGGLWLRVLGDAEVFCAACAAALSKLALQSRSLRTRMPVSPLAAGCPEVVPFSEGGQA